MRLSDLIAALQRAAQANNPMAGPGPMPGPEVPGPLPLPPPNAALPPAAPLGLAAPWPQDPRNPWIAGGPFPLPLPPMPPGPPAVPPAGQQPLPVLFDLLRGELPGAPSPGPEPMMLSSHSALLGPDEGDRQPPAGTATGQASAAANPSAADTGSTPTLGRPHLGEPETYDAAGAAAELAQAPSPHAPAAQPPAANREPAPQSAKTISPRNVEVTYDDGTYEIRSEGTRSWRNNNPGNLKYKTPEAARVNGAIGTDEDGFAVFPSAEEGRRAALANLRSRNYRNLTIDEGIARWADKKNDPTSVAAYQKFVTQRTGLDGHTLLRSLTQPQLERLYEEMRRFEKWDVGTTSPRYSGHP